jgi:hypothetical protein
MIFQAVQIGGPGLTFPASVHPRVPFSFPKPVQTAHAVLQSFYVENVDKDRDVKDIQVSLITFFDPVQSATSGEVEIQLLRTGSTESIFLAPELIEGEVRALVIGI